jgi:DNA repair protein RadC
VRFEKIKKFHNASRAKCDRQPSPVQRKDPIRPPADAFKIDSRRTLKTFVEALGEETHEWLIALYVDKDFQLLSIEEIGQGDVTGVDVDIGLIIARGRGMGASAFFLAHNHPSGDPTPSRSDIAVTRRLAEIARGCEMPLITHVVVSASGMRDIGFW